MTGSPSPELDALLSDLLLPNAGPAYDEIRGRALDRLLEIGDEAHDRILAMADVDDPLPQVLAVLPEFGRESSVPVLARALHRAADPTTVTAGAALADHPSPEAEVALVAALDADRDQTVRSAELGLERRRARDRGELG